GMRADELNAAVTIEEIAANHAKNIDRRVEQVARDHRELVLLRAILPRRIGGMQEERHVELFRGVEGRVEPFVRQIITAHAGGDVSSDETEVSNATAKLGCSRDRILHGQERPGRKS